MRLFLFLLLLAGCSSPNEPSHSYYAGQSAFYQSGVVIPGTLSTDTVTVSGNGSGSIILYDRRVNNANTSFDTVSVSLNGDVYTNAHSDTIIYTPNSLTWWNIDLRPGRGGRMFKLQANR